MSPLWAHIFYFLVWEDSLICLCFHIVMSLSVSLLQHGVYSALLLLFLLVSAIDRWSLWPACVRCSFEGLFIHLFCLTISASPEPSINEPAQALFGSLESSIRINLPNKSEEFQPISWKALIDHRLQYLLANTWNIDSEYLWKLVLIWKITGISLVGTIGHRWWWILTGRANQDAKWSLEQLSLPIIPDSLCVISEGTVAAFDHPHPIRSRLGQELWNLWWFLKTFCWQLINALWKTFPESNFNCN